ncbi:MAG: hypothetical protein KDD44_11330 [Bdellovibrionales bacterium]|nr:hypothetical protein [Bdellovibrionales bacterium]
MSTFQTDSDGTPANVAVSPSAVDSNIPAAALATVADQEPLRRYPDLFDLYLRLHEAAVRPAGSPREETVLPYPVDLNSLEMLEAELINQGYTELGRLPHSLCSHSEAEHGAFWTRVDGCQTMAQRASLDATVLRWRARRRGYRAHELSFLVDVPRFAVTWAAELLESATDAAHDGETVLMLRSPEAYTVHCSDAVEQEAKLHYLNGLAAFLLGRAESRHTPYARGLKALLRVLVSPNTKQLSSVGSIEPTYPASRVRSTVVLPTTRDLFYRALRR